MENFRDKNSFINLVEKYKGDKSISIENLYNTLKGEIEEDKKAEELKEKEVISEFSNSYLKKFSQDGVLGRFGKGELKLLKIESITADSYTDTWDRTYIITGEKMNVSFLGVTIRDFEEDNGSVESMFTVSGLRQYSKISKEEFEKYLEEGKSINDRIKSLLNP